MVIATGFFDGVHIGHRHVISTLIDEARRRGDESMVVTFWPHPRNVLQDDARNLRLLTSLDEKTELLKGLGVDNVEVLPFTKEFSHLTSRHYIHEYLVGRFSCKAILLGYDNHLGSDLAGPDEIVKIADDEGVDVILCSKIEIPGGMVVSSTKIRNSISSGCIEEANQMLGYGYSLLGVVVAGNQLGRTIGFPTANMQLYEPLKLVPGNGVYKVRVEAVGRVLAGMCNIGLRPTVSHDTRLTIETNIFDFDEDIYGLPIKVTFLNKIRDEHRFSSIGELKAQLEQDRNSCM
ncbi:MAG: riboflavin biosynthesis protein RibF [Bacteroidales bacterium]|nr:riboflavin biosynthesis protein RibF [Bacteroidales bacterium]MDY6000628.1 riboflavin biosynthesis protein RibF [Candidatus Cryptobacteroides sp.]